MHEGLKENTVFLFNYLRSRGYDVVVGKVFDDNLYAYVRGDVEERRIEYSGLHVKVFSRSSSIEAFKKMSRHVQDVNKDIILEV